MAVREVARWLWVASCVALTNCGRSSDESPTVTAASTGPASHESSTPLAPGTQTTDTPATVDVTHSSTTSTSDESTAVESDSVSSPATTTSTSESTEAVPIDSMTLDAGSSDAAVTSSAATSGPDTRDVDCATLVVNAKLGKIATVGVVTFSADFHVESANVEFAPVGSDTYVTAPVDLNEPNYKTYLLGMKQSKEYVFRVVVNAQGKICTSADQTITTGLLDELAQNVFFGHATENEATRGFVVTTTFNGANGQFVYIFDTEGDLVWAYPGVYGGSRARLDWNAKNVWSIAAQTGTPRVLRVSMDGEEEEGIEALPAANHDLTVLPNGHIAVISFGGDDPASCTRVLDYDPATKTVREVVANVNTLWQPVDDRCHSNALTYQEATNTFIISDLEAGVFVKFSAVDGAPIWQLGGANPIARRLTGGDQVWVGNHGHHLTEDGRFVFFNNDSPSDDYSAIREFQLDETAGTASGGEFFSDDAYTSFLGDVQVLKNGNLWVTYTWDAILREYDASHQILAEFRADVGYSYFMESLYEKPYGK